MGKLNSFRELKVYQKLKGLHLEVHRETLRFPKFETYELGSQVRDLDSRYDECGRMLEGLHQSLSEWKGTTRTGKVVRENRALYGSASAVSTWPETAALAIQIDEDFPWTP